MSEEKILKELLAPDDPIGRFIRVGVVIFAAVAVVGSFKLDLMIAISTALAIILLSAFALVVYAFVRWVEKSLHKSEVIPVEVVNSVATALEPEPQEVTDLRARMLAMGATIDALRKSLDDQRKKCAATIVIVIFVAVPSGILALSAARQIFPVVAALLPNVTPVYCLLRFWEPCDLVSEQVASQLPAPTPAPVPAPVVPVVERQNYKVFVQFAGVIQRESVQTMMTTLEQTGWDVQGTSGGGERTGSAAGLNTIKYSANNKAAAEALAMEVQSANVSGEPISTTEVSGMEDDRLEVWISR